MLAAICVLVIVCLTAAWGPGMHIWAAMQLISELQRKKRHGPSARVILDHVDPFLYGTIAADIINFKRFGGFQHHCHNWNMRARMAPYLTTDEQRAFALGYLCHLAADVGSHNHFVPYHRLAELTPRLMGHAFLESAADVMVGAGTWRVVEDIRRQRHLHALDEIIDKAVAVKALSLNSNRWIFRTLVLGQSGLFWRQARDMVKRRPAMVAIDKDLFRLLKRKILHDMRLVLDEVEHPELTAQDPSGAAPLRAARALRRQILGRYPSRQYALPIARKIARECFWLP